MLAAVSEDPAASAPPPSAGATAAAAAANNAAAAADDDDAAVTAILEAGEDAGCFAGGADGGSSEAIAAIAAASRAIRRAWAARDAPAAARAAIALSLVLARCPESEHDIDFSSGSDDGGGGDNPLPGRGPNRGPPTKLDDAVRALGRRTDGTVAALLAMLVEADPPAARGALATLHTLAARDRGALRAVWRHFKAAAAAVTRALVDGAFGAEDLALALELVKEWLEIPKSRHFCPLAGVRAMKRRAAVLPGLARALDRAAAQLRAQLGDGGPAEGAAAGERRSQFVNVLRLACWDVARWASREQLWESAANVWDELARDGLVACIAALAVAPPPVGRLSAGDARAVRAASDWCKAALEEAASCSGYGADGRRMPVAVACAIADAAAAAPDADRARAETAAAELLRGEPFNIQGTIATAVLLDAAGGKAAAEAKAAELERLPASIQEAIVGLAVALRGSPAAGGD